MLFLDGSGDTPTSQKLQYWRTRMCGLESLHTPAPGGVFLLLSPEQECWGEFPGSDAVTSPAGYELHQTVTTLLSNSDIE